MQVTALVPWYGSNRILASRVGDLLKNCSWVGVPFAGGMSELAHIPARTLLVNDLHRHVINLANVLSCEKRRCEFLKKVKNLAFHPDTLRGSQIACQAADASPRWWEFADSEQRLQIAVCYFVSQWMGRSGKAGCDDEFKGGLPVRWTASGGDSNTRYRSAVKSLAAWGRIMRRCNFTVLDFQDFLTKCKDQPGHGIYCDPPFPAGGECYKHKFTPLLHQVLRNNLLRFAKTKVVVRYYDHPLVRELYPEGEWRWHFLEGRKQTNEVAPEVLLEKN